VSTIEILDHLFFIERGYLNGNHFVYWSETPILIDSGYISDFKETERLISGVGVDLRRVALIVNTHTHCDHIGGNHLIQQLSGCDIAMHHVGKHFIDTRNDWATWWRYFHQEADFFKCTQALNDGDIITLGPHRFQVFYTPGHASDGIVLYNSKDKILISSDTLWEKDMAVMVPRVEGSLALFNMKTSLEKLKSLDIDRVYPGHGKPFDQVKKAIDRGIERVEKYMAERVFIGEDLLKKILVYTLLMKKRVAESDLFDYLMGTTWFKETVDLYFDGRYEKRYDETMAEFLDRGIVTREDGVFMTTVKP